MGEPPNAPAEGISAGRLVQIDGLRAIAALSVVAFHFTKRYDDLLRHSPPLPWHANYGYLGVPLFFAISGFVIFMTLDRVHRPSEFVISRFSRLFPAYWAAVAVTWLVLWWSGMGYGSATLPQAVVNLTMLQYFLSVPNVDDVYWTLSVELVFYTWMLLLWIHGLLRHPTPVFLCWVLGALAVALMHRMGLSGSSLIQYFLLTRWIPWFALGIAAYILNRNGRLGAPHIALVALSLAAIAVEDGGLIAVFGAIVAAAVLAASRAQARVLQWRPIVFLGLISYPLYLLHNNVGFVVIYHLERRGVEPVAAVAMAVVVTVALATVLHYTVEMPGTRWIRRRLRAKAPERRPYPRRVWASGCALVIALAAVLLAVSTRLHHLYPKAPGFALNAFTAPE